MRSMQIRRVLLLVLLAGGLLLSHPLPSPAQSERGNTAACRQAADRMDGMLSEALGGDEGMLRDLLPSLRATYAPFRGARADCAASLAMNEAVVLLLLEDYREALSVLDEYARLYEGHISPDVWVDYHFNRGWLLSRLGQTQASTEDYVRAAALADDLPPFRGAAAHLYAALTFVEVRDFPRARTYLQLADSLARANVDSAEVRTMLGEIELEHAITMQREIEAGLAPDSLHRQAAERARQSQAWLSDEVHQSPERAMAQLVLARAALGLGDYEGTRAALDAARPLVAEAEAYAGYVRVSEQMTEGDLAMATADPARARMAYGRALAAAQTEGLPTQALDALLHLGQAAEADGAEAVAAERYREAIGLGETIRQRQGLQDWSLSASELTAQPYTALAALLARQGEVDEAFQMLDASRARRLLDLRASLQARRTLDPDDRVRMDSLLDALDGVRLAIPGALTAQRAELDAEATRIQRTLGEISGLTLEPPAPLALGALADTLGRRNQLLISYLIGEQESWAFLASDGGVRAQRLAVTRDSLRQSMARISAMWRSDRAMATDREFQLDALETLHGHLLAPLEPLIPEGIGLVTVPPAELATLPFGMLVEPGGPRDYANARYVIRKHPVSTELAAALLLEPGTSREGGERLVFGRSTFPDRADLPFVRDEAKRVSRALPSPRLRLDDRATESDLLSGIASASLVHLASHATADPEFPLYSHISLADHPDAPDDGTLHLYELESEPLSADLVVLSGCSTARGRELKGEGMIGLQYGVRAAGAQSALATLWPVDDRATVEIMGTFYKALGEGMSKDRALQQAQLSYLENASGIDASPFYWAPAVLSGNVAPAPWDTPSRLAWWLGLFSALAVTASVAWAFTQRRRRV